MTESIQEQIVLDIENLQADPQLDKSLKAHQNVLQRIKTTLMYDDNTNYKSHGFDKLATIKKKMDQVRERVMSDANYNPNITISVLGVTFYIPLNADTYDWLIEQGVAAIDEGMMPIED